MLHKYISAHSVSHLSKIYNVHVKALPWRLALNCNPKTFQKVSHIHVYRMEGSMLPHYMR